MKKLLTLLVCAAGFFLIAAPIYMNQPNAVFINGKPFANAQTINGIIAVAVDDFSKAVGGTVHVQGNQLALTAPRLEASASADTFTLAGHGTGGGEGHAAATGGAGAGSPSPNTVAGASSGGGNGSTNPNSIGSATGGAGAGKVTFHEFTITKTSDRASPVFFSQGKAYVSLADVARLFGGTFSVNGGGTLKPGQRIDLHIAPSQGAIIVVAR